MGLSQRREGRSAIGSGSFCPDSSLPSAFFSFSSFFFLFFSLPLFPGRLFLLVCYLFIVTGCVFAVTGSFAFRYRHGQRCSQDRVFNDLWLVVAVVVVPVVPVINVADRADKTLLRSWPGCRGVGVAGVLRGAVVAGVLARRCRCTAGTAVATAGQRQSQEDKENMGERRLP